MSALRHRALVCSHDTALHKTPQQLRRTTSRANVAMRLRCFVVHGGLDCRCSRQSVNLDTNFGTAW